MKDDTRQILRLAVPATIENILQALVGFIDTLMIAQLGLFAVTGVGLGNNILAVYLAVFLALGIASSSLITRKLGANDEPAAKTYAAHALMFAVVTGFLLAVLTLIFGRSMLSAMGAKDEVMAAASTYFLVVGAGSIFQSLLVVSGSIVRATGDTKTPMIVNTAVNFINIGVDYILIFGLGPIPALGVLGTAIGTVVARVIGFIWMLRVIQKSTLALSLSDFTWQGSREVISLSIPAALERLVMRLGQVLYYSLIVSIGVTTYASHVIAGNIESFVYMPGYGLATAASILAGRAYGSGQPDKARMIGVRSVKIGLLIMGVGGLLLFFGSPLFATLFTDDQAAIGKVVTALRIDAFVQIPLAIGLILTGALQGIGDMKTPLLSTIIGMWGVRVIGVFFLGKQLGLDIAGIWISILIDNAIRALVLSLRFKRLTTLTPLDDNTAKDTVN